MNIVYSADGKYVGCATPVTTGMLRPSVKTKRDLLSVVVVFSLLEGKACQEEWNEVQNTDILKKC